MNFEIVHIHTSATLKAMTNIITINIVDFNLCCLIGNGDQYDRIILIVIYLVRIFVKEFIGILVLLCNNL